MDNMVSPYLLLKVGITRWNLMRRNPHRGAFNMARLTRRQLFRKRPG
jgi:hypothetical protein